MRVGDYVRFDYHRVSVPIQIAKIIETHYDNEDDSVCYLTDVELVIDESNLVKEPSPNITDLIEVGDYVNGFRIDDITEKDKDHPERIVWHLTYYGDDDIPFRNDEIKSIVTHEQFSAMEYKVESEVK